MALEDLTGNKYISDLVSTNPVGATDPKGEGDDHIRGIKNVLKKTFPNINGAVTVTPNDLNLLSGLASYTISIGDITKLKGIGAYSVNAADVSRLNNAADTVTGFLAGAMEWVSNEVTANSFFDVAANITATWASIGAPGDGANKDWTALSSVPADAKWVDVRFITQVTYTGTTLYINAAISGRVNGSSEAYGDSNILVNMYFTNSSTIASTPTTIYYSQQARIPISGRKFDLYKGSSSTTISVAKMFLIGFGR